MTRLESGQTTISPAPSVDDLVRLQIATFLSLSVALSGAGVIRLADIATILSTHVLDEDQAPWAQIVRALAVVLSRDHAGADPAGETAQPDPPARRTFVVIEGGFAADGGGATPGSRMAPQP